MSYYIIKGEDLYKLIPQRPPIVEVDTLYEASATEANAVVVLHSLLAPQRVGSSRIRD